MVIMVKSDITHNTAAAAQYWQIAIKNTANVGKLMLNFDINTISILLLGNLYRYYQMSITINVFLVFSIVVDYWFIAHVHPHLCHVKVSPGSRVSLMFLLLSHNTVGIVVVVIILGLWLA